LFDLDGTLLDTAPDLALALNTTRGLRGLPPLPFALIRPHVSHGSYALTRLGFDAPEDSDPFEQFRLELLDSYHRNLALDTRLFDGMAETLDDFERESRLWGIVTNKPAWLTEPLLAALRLDTRAACIVSGDSVARRKPDPDPLLLAAQLLGVAPRDCIYIGDAERDVVAGAAAGMVTGIALYGYIGEQDRPHGWGAERLLRTPAEIAAWVTEIDRREDE
jgi:phosphoglycolate phosphatase